MILQSSEQGELLRTLLLLPWLLLLLLSLMLLLLMSLLLLLLLSLWLFGLLLLMPRRSLALRRNSLEEGCGVWVAG
jgi:hypothetical protein